MAPKLLESRFLQLHYAIWLEPQMSKKNDHKPESVHKQAWPILAIGMTVAGLLTWLGWAVTRPDVIDRDRR